MELRLMAPQLLGYYWVSSSPRLPQVLQLPCASGAQRRRVLPLAPSRRRAGLVRVVADAGPTLALDRSAMEVMMQFPTEEESAVGNEEDNSMDDREKLRRMRISQANKGNTPWNKGRKHSPETLQRIRERTRIAMQDPKVSFAKRVCMQVKKKLMNLGHAQSEETKIKISLGVRRGWNLRLQKLMVQDGCFVEWRDMIADAARKGFADGVVLRWNSHKILTEQLRQEWLAKIQKKRSMPRPTGNRRAPKTPEQRRKIAEAIAAKWLDQEYRERVCSAINSYHGTSAGSKTSRKPRTAREPGAKSEPLKKKPFQYRSIRVEDVHGATAVVKRKKSATPYKDPMSGEKLEMITKIRDQRVAMEIEMKEATKRARSLIAEAEKAANALENVAVTNPFAQASLIEARKLVTEARILLECVNDDERSIEICSDDASMDSAISGQNYELENESDVIKQENRPVNGMKLPPRIVNSMNFYFDVSALSETELSVYQRIENSMERAYLLPSASSTTQDVNGNLGVNDLYLSQPLVNNDQIDQIVAGTTENCPVGLPEEDTSSPAKKSKMRWVRGRLVEVEV